MSAVKGDKESDPATINAATGELTWLPTTTGQALTDTTGARRQETRLKCRCPVGNKASRITGCAVGFIVVTDLLCSGVLSLQNYETLHLLFIPQMG